ncbi:DUF3306 domain-containing protein [Massilia soli]|uniref:DUF3306 domain-containing protein n=1 Tax=Massilia soli TaxID=2792854 RepID=UPI001CC14AC2|nr:DUF3306 domain-containing protein [Massilia soli]
MPAERFFQRWSRLKAEPAAPVAPGTPSDPAATAPAAQAPIPPGGQPARQAHAGSEAAHQPTLDDVARLHAGSDYAAFVARGVDTSVRRGALKKLFADPHFNIGDGLDLYMGDYNKPDPIPAAMMSALRHTQSFFAQAYPDKKEGDAADAPALEAGDTGAPVTLARQQAQRPDSAGAACSTDDASSTDAAGSTETAFSTDATCEVHR